MRRSKSLLGEWEEDSQVLLHARDNDRHLAGLIFIYDTSHWHYLYITKKRGKKVCKVLSSDNRKLIYYDNEVEVSSSSAILSAKLSGNKIAFFADGKLVADNIDASILSDEHIYLGFTGAMVGVNCIDCEKREKRATFKEFEYKRL